MIHINGNNVKQRKSVLFGILLSLFVQAISITSMKVQAAPLDVNFPGGNTISLNIFNPTTGWSNMGLFSILALIARFAFIILFVIWIFLIINAGLKIVRSQGGDDIKGGMKRIKNIWIGITIGLVFFVAVSFIGAFAGVGTIFQWSDNLKECSCENPQSGSDCYHYAFQAQAHFDNMANIQSLTCGKTGEPGYGKGWIGSNSRCQTVDNCIETN